MTEFSYKVNIRYWR